MENFVAEAEAFFKTLNLLEWGIIGGVILLVIIIPSILSNRKKKQRARVMPRLALESFQVSPLGRDAFFRIKNTGESATLTSLFIRGRRDIIAKNAFVGHQLDRGTVYGILLEATADEKITTNFSVEITYFDQMRNVYRQTFDLKNSSVKNPKLMQKGK